MRSLTINNKQCLSLIDTTSNTDLIKTHSDFVILLYSEYLLGSVQSPIISINNGERFGRCMRCQRTGVKIRTFFVTRCSRHRHKRQKQVFVRNSCDDANSNADSLRHMAMRLNVVSIISRRCRAQ